MGGNGVAGLQASMPETGTTFGKVAETPLAASIGTALESARRELMAAGQVLGDVLERHAM